MKTAESRVKRQRGAAMLEFAMSFMVVFSLFAGTFQWGYTFYVYNTLVTQVRKAARYASTQPFDPTNPASTAQFISAVQNVVVYGTAAPAERTVPCTKGLTISNVSVMIDPGIQGSAAARSVDISITDFTIDSVFGKITLDGRPNATFPYTAASVL